MYNPCCISGKLKKNKPPVKANVQSQKTQRKKTVAGMRAAIHLCRALWEVVVTWLKISIPLQIIYLQKG